MRNSSVLITRQGHFSLLMNSYLGYRIPHKETLKGLQLTSTNQFKINHKNTPMYKNTEFESKHSSLRSQKLPKTRFWNCDFRHLSTAHCLKIAQNVAFEFLAFPPNFCPIKTDLSGNTVWPNASDFQLLAKLTIFGI